MKPDAMGWVRGLCAGLLLAAAGATFAGVGSGSGWRETAWPQHVARIDDALATARAVDATDGAYARDFAEARALLGRARKPLPLGEVTGAWQVRSIQVNDYGTFAYPWFKATIRRTPLGLRFEKTTGSQRRSGMLWPHGDGRTLVFLGGATVNQEPQVAYSTRRAGGEAAESDTVGRVYRIGRRELLMVLDAEGGRYELYHLRK